MLIGYARVSTAEQTLALQEDALQAAGCTTIFRDTMSGRTTDRPGLSQAIAEAQAGDTLVVWRLDRLGRSLSHLIQVVQDLHAKGVEFRSLQEQIDSGSAGGQLIFHIFGALAEFERALIRERTMAGLAAARARGRMGGRPRRLTPDQVQLAQRLLASPDVGVSQVAEMLRVSRQTVYRALKRAAGSPN